MLPIAVNQAAAICDLPRLRKRRKSNPPPSTLPSNGKVPGSGVVPSLLPMNTEAIPTKSSWLSSDPPLSLNPKAMVFVAVVVIYHCEAPLAPRCKICEYQIRRGAIIGVGLMPPFVTDSSPVVLVSNSVKPGVPVVINAIVVESRAHGNSACHSEGTIIVVVKILPNSSGRTTGRRIANNVCGRIASHKPIILPASLPI